MQKFSMLEVGSPEYGVTRNYLDWMTSLPWGKTTEDTKELGTAAKILNTHHEGLEDVKLRILEFLALGIIKGDVAGSIICLVGPPGVGKTSLAVNCAVKLTADGRSVALLDADFGLANSHILLNQKKNGLVG